MLRDKVGSFHSHPYRCLSLTVPRSSRIVYGRRPPPHERHEGRSERCERQTEGHEKRRTVHSFPVTTAVSGPLHPQPVSVPASSRLSSLLSSLRSPEAVTNGLRNEGREEPDERRE